MTEIGVYVPNKQHYLNKKMFLDEEPVDIARYDQHKYPVFNKLTKQQRGFFWQPEEVDVYKDATDFNSLTINEQHIFTSNLKRQILLDSVQGRAPSLAFLPIATLPEIETFIETWSFFESLHNFSYTHIIQNVYSNPSFVFDQINSIPEILECADDISDEYDLLVKYNANPPNDVREHKRALWMALNAVNILEGIRFYVSFACSWAFAELKKMEGNAKIIKFIARDENLHLAATQNILRLLPRDDSDFVEIAANSQQSVVSMFVAAVEQEKRWAEYLFKDGSMIGLNTQLLCSYIEWIACKRMQALKLPCPYSPGRSNPLPWTEKWIAGGDVQVAPQETEISSYVVGGIKKDDVTSALGAIKL